jgi:hypothetical protein
LSPRRGQRHRPADRAGRPHCHPVGNPPGLSTGRDFSRARGRRCGRQPRSRIRSASGAWGRILTAARKDGRPQFERGVLEVARAGSETARHASPRAACGSAPRRPACRLRGRRSR